MRYRDTEQGSAEQGFTLPELLIALVLGLTLMGAVLSVYMTTLKTSGENNAQAQLNHNLRASLDLILSDLKRAGGIVLPLGSGMEKYAGNRFQDSTSHLRLRNCDAANECSCATYSYDLESDGDPYDSDGEMNHFGFKLNADGELQMRKGPSLAENSVHPGCSYDNSNNQWEALTDDDISITDFAIYYVDRDGNPIAAPQEVVLENGGRLQERNLEVRISGRKDDFELTVTGKVRVRNDRYIQP